MRIDDTEPPWGPMNGPAAAAPSLVTSDDAVVVVSLARWMRFMGIVYIVVAGLAVVALSAMAMLGRGAMVVAVIAAAFAIAVIAAGTWLREAGDQFHRGISDDDVGILGAGFGNLRKYLILFGVAELLTLANALRSMVSP